MNVIGFRTLLGKEIRRFLKVPGQTIGQPVVTTALYFLVFGYALGSRVREIDGVRYDRFIVPGLVLLALIQNAFLNTSSSMFIAKIQGTVVDLLVAPLGVLDLLGGFVLAGVLRGLLVGGVVFVIAGLFTGFQVAHPLWALVFAVLVAATFAQLGLVVAIWSEKFEQLNLVPTFVITPLTFLGGVFFSPDMLDEPMRSHHPGQSGAVHGRGAALRDRGPGRRLALAGPGGDGRAVRGDRRPGRLDAGHRLQAARLTATAPTGGTLVDHVGAAAASTAGASPAS